MVADDLNSKGVTMEQTEDSYDAVHNAQTQLRIHQNSLAA